VQFSVIVKTIGKRVEKPLAEWKPIRILPVA